MGKIMKICQLLKKEKFHHDVYYNFIKMMKMMKMMKVMKVMKVIMMIVLIMFSFLI